MTKEKLLSSVAAQQEHLFDLSCQIFDFNEPNGTEYKSSALCADELEKLGFTVEQEAYRPVQKDTLRMLRCGDVVLELFDRPAGKAATDPDTLGARHIAFHVESVEKAVAWLNGMGIATDPPRNSPFTGKPLAFFYDPDGLPLEVIE